MTLGNNAKKAMKEFHDLAKKCCDAQKDLFKQTSMLTEKVPDIETFFKITNFVQLPCIQVSVRTREQNGRLTGQMYHKLALKWYLSDAKKLVNKSCHTKLLAAFIYYALYHASYTMLCGLLAKFTRSKGDKKGNK